MYRSRRLDDIQPFHVMELLRRARELEAQGRDIIHMEVGEPDFPTPAPIVEAAQAFIGRGDVHTTRPASACPRCARRSHASIRIASAPTSRPSASSSPQGPRAR